MWSRQEYLGSYPMICLARSIARSVPNSPISRVSGASGKTSARNSRDGRFMTVSAAAMMTLWLPVVSASRPRRQAAATSLTST